MDVQFETIYPESSKADARRLLNEKIKDFPPSLEWWMGSEPNRHPDAKAKQVLVHGVPAVGQYLNGSVPERLPYALELGVADRRGDWMTYSVESVSAMIYGPGLRVVVLTMQVQKLHDQGHYFAPAVYELRSRWGLDHQREGRDSVQAVARVGRGVRGDGEEKEEEVDQEGDQAAGGAAAAVGGEEGEVDSGGKVAGGGEEGWEVGAASKAGADVAEVEEEAEEVRAPSPTPPPKGGGEGKRH